MARVTRRKFLKASGSGALAAKTSGIAGILAASRAPAYAQATTLHWLKWNDFVPAGDEILRKSMLPEAEKALGFKINMETIGLNDLQPRATASIQTQSGPDIIMIFDNKAQLYADSCADVSAVCEAIGSSQGGYYDLAKANTHDGKKWIAVPYCIIGLMIAYRKSWFDEIGVSKFPETWSIGKPARSSRPTAIRSDRPSVTRLATHQALPTPTCGHGAAAKSRPTARRSSSTRKRQSSR
jgi:multiple sugar transport system substrate-binding protein